MTTNVIFMFKLADCAGSKMASIAIGWSLIMGERAEMVVTVVVNADCFKNSEIRFFTQKIKLYIRKSPWPA